MNDVFLTKEGYQKIQEELNNLYKEKQEINQEIQETREQGDLRENAGYQYAKEKQLKILRRISELETMIRKARIVNENEINKDEIRMGAKIKIMDLKSGDEKNYCIVSVAESDPLNGKISINSPLAQGLLGAKIDEIRKISLPNGEKEFKILSIEY
ncbi:MAG: transcription elongation factor GreA [Elusimicrobiales bacterium]|jgi:transcription elongation factor GreA|nr:transcription elongation factor GreA [Elusimicrobiales bacterium]HPO94828.1 transcription elongation factor GreA [Elusimicrobiales bacterium]